MNSAILLYHYVLPIDDARRSLVQGVAAKYLITPEQLRDQLAFIKAQSETYTFGDPNTFPNTGITRTEAIYLSFDDGTKTDYEYSMPVIEELGIRAAFFIIAGFIGKDNYLAARQLRELQAQGHVIGSHGYNHVRFDEISEKKQILEIDKSKKVLEDTLGTAVVHFAYPHGVLGTVNPLARNYSYAFTTKPSGLQGHFSRITIKQDTSLEDLAGLIEREKTW